MSIELEGPVFQTPWKGSPTSAGSPQRWVLPQDTHEAAPALTSLSGMLKKSENRGLCVPGQASQLSSARSQSERKRRRRLIS